MGWSELLIVGIVALIVVGPKDLPGMFRELGKFSAKLRGMARDFQRAMEDAADQSGVGDVAKTLRTATNPSSAVSDTLSKATEGLTNWDPDAPVDGPIPGKHTAEFTKERQEAAEKIRKVSAEKAEERLRKEAEAAEAKASASKAAPAEIEDDPGMVAVDDTPPASASTAPEAKST